MRGRLAIALSVSLVLIGFASWSRLSGGEKTQPSLLAVAQFDTNPEEVLRDFLATKETVSASSTETLTDTDLLGRQLMLDYVALAANGGATEEALAALAERYVENLPTLTNAEALTAFDLKVVSNNRGSFQTYAAALENIYRTYATGLLGAYSVESLKIGSKSASMSNKMSEIYRQTALKLRAVPVPADVAEEHLALLNIYLSNASAMESLAVASSDPAQSFAGILAYKANATKEQEIISKIEKILEKNGV
jgi:hypothetical protein